MNPANEIAKALDEAMQAFNGGRGMSQAELSRLSTVPQPTISRTLKGKSIPETETLSKLVAALGNTVKLSKAIAMLVPEEKTASVGALTVKAFAFPCGECGQVSKQSFIDLEVNEAITCTCGASTKVCDVYSEADLAEFLKALGSIRPRKK